MQKIILASKSPRRKQLLEWAEIDFTVEVSDTDETYPEGMSFTDAAMFIAEEKANAIAKMRGTEIPILAADTLVICNNEHFAKPAISAEAIQMISALSGATHLVITGVCILYKDRIIRFADTTRVTFHPLQKEQIEYYVNQYQPFDKAGAYAIQEWIGVIGIQSIEGDFYNVMGLPISRVVQELKLIFISD